MNPKRSPAKTSAKTLSPTWRTQLSDHVIGLCWHPNGKSVAVATVDGHVALIDAEDGHTIWHKSIHRVGAADLHLSANGERLVSAGHDGVARLLATHSGDVLAELPGGAGWVERASFSPSGELILVAAGKHVRLFGCSGELLLSLPDAPFTVSDIAWFHHDPCFAVLTYGVLRVFVPSASAPVQSYEWKGSMLKLAVSPNGRYLATGNQDCSVHLFLTGTTKDLEMSGYPAKVRLLSWDHQSRLLATGGGAACCVWDFGGKGPAGSRPVTLSASRSMLSALAFQHQGDLLASGNVDGTLALWLPTQDEAVRAQGTLGTEISQLAWSPDDRRLAAGCADGSVRCVSCALR